MDVDANRTQFILANQAKATVICLDACFCSKDGEEELCNRPGFLDDLAKEIAKDCSAWQIENAVCVLQKAYKIAAERPRSR